MRRSLTASLALLLGSLSLAGCVVAPDPHERRPVVYAPPRVVHERPVYIEERPAVRYVPRPVVVHTPPRPYDGHYDVYR